MKKIFYLRWQNFFPFGSLINLFVTYALKTVFEPYDTKSFFKFANGKNHAISNSFLSRDQIHTHHQPFLSLIPNVCHF